MAARNLKDLLQHAEDNHDPSGVLAYPLGNTEVGRKLTYGELRSQAEHNAQLLGRLDGFTMGSVILIHFSDHLDAIVWFWSVFCAGCIPAMSIPLSNNLTQKEKRILHLYTLLRNPICITRRASLDEFGDQKVLPPRSRPHLRRNLLRLYRRTGLDVPPRRQNPATARHIRHSRL